VRRDVNSESVHAEEVIGAIQGSNKKYKIKCADFSAEICISTITARKICCDDLLFPYKMKRCRPLWEDGTATRYEALRSAAGGQSGCLQCHWTSDEAHFFLDGYTDKQNVRFLASENPRIIIANPLHPESTTIANKCP
jgi:hypothetical protein